ncbi:MAG: carboxypeptidase regulatory-like domain-containing protein [Bacteroidales bacterium]|nr:carboxypeptidase regulatory-like domain-containing protein [Bacteroidales bacterium]
MKKILLMATFVVAGLSWTLGQNTIDDPFFDHVPFIGAIGADDWTSGWSEFDPQNAVYSPTTVNIPAGNITSDVTWSSGTSPVLGAASFSNSYLQDPFYDVVTYCGAFGSTDWTAGWSEFDPQNAVYPPTTTVIPGGDITTNQTWTSGNVYLLNGWVYVKAGVVLTIQAGTIIRGDKTNQGALVIERGAQLIAQGTAAQPIVFTSNQAAGSRDYGDWGGVVICGNAAINVPGGTAIIEGGLGAVFGGGATPNDNDNSGILNYVRIEFPGIAFSPNNEINGLTMGGVGRGTQIDYVQVSYSGDDSYEWFGGTVNAKHLIALRALDDDMDSDLGFTGKVQHVVILRDPAQADVSGSRAFESDNDAAGSSNTPLTKPVFSNVSVFGPKVNSGTTINSNYSEVANIRLNSSCSIFNSILAGWKKGLRIDGAASKANATNNILRIENTFEAGMVTNFQSSFEENYFLTPFRNNSLLTNNTSLNIADPFNLTNPNFLPLVGSNVFLLDGWVYVKSGATVTIDPGTIIRGSKANQGALIIERGAKLIAEGTANAPIVFTSNQGAGSRDYGDWGGVLVCGNAAINVPGGTAIIEGGTGAVYGGGTTPNDNDNSGVIKYVRIEFPGIAFSPNNEINGLTMGGVGKGTEIDYVQVSYCGDDSFEWFGGAVNAKHLIALRSLDDDYDTDLGFTGMVQYAISLRDPAQADVSGSRCFESDNDAAGSSNTPQTRPVFSNVSSFGPLPTPSTPINTNYKESMNIRLNSATNVYNSVFAGWPKGLKIDGAASQQNATNNILRMENTFLAGMNTFFNSAFEDNYFFSTSPNRHNDTLVNNYQIMITDPFNLTNPDFKPLAGSPVLVRSYWCKEVSGTITYDNSVNSPLANVTVSVNDGAKGVVATTTTNASGQYKFDYVFEGSYTLSASSTASHGGINSTDALLIRRHSIGLTTLTGLRLTGADVNLSSSVNSTDALLVRRRSIGLSVGSWTMPDWIFENPAITITNSNVSQNFLGLCSGDVNGSYTPAE